MKNVVLVVITIAVAVMPAIEARFASVKVNLEMIVAEERRNLSEEMIRLCAEETDISMEDLQKFRQHDFSNSNYTTQCFAHCVYEHMGMIQNGVFVERDALDALSELTESKNLIFKECAGIKGENKCETAFKIHKCRHEVRSRIINRKDVINADIQVTTATPPT